MLAIVDLSTVAGTFGREVKGTGSREECQETHITVVGRARYETVWFVVGLGLCVHVRLCWKAEKVLYCSRIGTRAKSWVFAVLSSLVVVVYSLMTVMTLTVLSRYGNALCYCGRVEKERAIPVR